MDKIAILDFGGQYCHLIARRIRDLGVLTEIYPSDIKASSLVSNADIKGVILSGGARSVYDKNAPPFDKEILNLAVPILGICYGHQLLAYLLGGKVKPGQAGEYGLTQLDVSSPSGLFTNSEKTTKVWMNHRDVVVSLPPAFCRYFLPDRPPRESPFFNSRHYLF